MIDPTAQLESRPTILIVDDAPENLRILSGILRQHYEVRVADSGARAIELALSDKSPDLILLDVVMPVMDGFETCRKLKSNWKTEKIPVIFITALGEVTDEARGFDAGAADYITKPVSPPKLLARVRTHLALYDQSRALEGLVEQRTRQLNDTRLEIIRRLGRAAEFKDNETGLHVIRMSHYCRLIALGLGMDSSAADLLLQTSPMHDIGKIGIPDRVLLKPGKLDEEEWIIMRTHPEIGAAIIGKHDSPLLETARIIALTHHEKWDGSGYPFKIRGKDIPVEGRIAAVADVFDALTSERPYKGAWSVENAIALIDSESGKHFDPLLVTALHKVMPDIQDVYVRYAEPSRPVKFPA